MSADTYDFIIVGAGSAGCALADKLSADPGNRVLLIEAGGSDRRLAIKAPIGYGLAYTDAAVNWRYSSEPDPGLDGRVGYWPRGKVLGGSSSINAMVYCRGLPRDYDDWRAAGNPGWGWDDLEPIYRSFERRIAADGSSRGSGPLVVCDRGREYHPLRRHFLAAAAELGWATTDLLCEAPEGVGPYAITTRNGWRCSAADAFLRPAMGRANLAVLTHALAERVVFEGRRAVGVACRTRAGSAAFACRGEVILSAGAVNSPQLLQLSGIGPGPLLRSLGVDVVHDNPAVGGGLHDHLGVSYFYRATEPTLNQELGAWRGRVKAALQFLVARSGPFSLSVNQMGGLVKSAPDAPHPDLQLYFNPLSYSTTYEGKRPMLKPDRFPGFITGFNACRPTSEGRIDVASPDPAAPPRIMPNSLSTANDVAEALTGARVCARLQGTAAMRRLVAEAAFDLTSASDEALIADFRARGASVYHACRTCRMAPESQGGVVGPDLKVYGVEGLRVADASIFPNITSANTNAPAILVGHKAAALISPR